MQSLHKHRRLHAADAEIEASKGSRISFSKWKWTSMPRRWIRNIIFGHPHPPRNDSGHKNHPPKYVVLQVTVILLILVLFGCLEKGKGPLVEKRLCITVSQETELMFILHCRQHASCMMLQGTHKQFLNLQVNKNAILWILLHLNASK